MERPKRHEVPALVEDGVMIKRRREFAGLNMLKASTRN
jgi:hypothetical protein